MMFWNDMYVIVGMVSVQFKYIFKRSLYLSYFLRQGGRYLVNLHLPNYYDVWYICTLKVIYM